jgi:hypothetical protein
VALYEQGNFVGASEQLRLLRQAKLVPFEVNLDGSTGLGTSLTDGTAAPKATRADGTTEVRVRLLQGALEWEQGKGEAAAATWRGALALEPGARFDFHASPGAQAELERVRHPASGPVAPNWPRVAVPAIAGAAVLVGGGILYGLARQGADELSAGDPTVRDLNALTRKNDTIRAEQTAGFLLGGAGILALGTAGVLWLTGHEAPPVTVLISARGAAVVWTGALP